MHVAQYQVLNLGVCRFHQLARPPRKQYRLTMERQDYQYHYLGMACVEALPELWGQ